MKPFAPRKARSTFERSGQRLRCLSYCMDGKPSTPANPSTAKIKATLTPDLRTWTCRVIGPMGARMSPWLAGKYLGWDWQVPRLGLVPNTCTALNRCCCVEAVQTRLHFHWWGTVDIDVGRRGRWQGPGVLLLAVQGVPVVNRCRRGR